MAPSSRPALRLTCWILLSLAVLAASSQSTAHASRFLSSFQQTPRSASNSEKPPVIRAELLHRDHPLSPLALAEGTTLTDRWAAAVKRSSNLIPSRGRRLADFQTPVTREGPFQGEYVMSISFGTPVQTFTGLVDTASELVWIQCVKCPGCFNFVQPGPLYDPLLSTSATNISCSDPQCSHFPNTLECSTSDTTCRIQYEYADDSTIQGGLLTERLLLTNTGVGADLTATDFVMGCMNNNTGIFDHYDGIVGFNRGDYSLPSQLSRLAYSPVFSLCLVPFMAATTNTSTILFGRTNPTVPPLTQTRILGSTGGYNVKMTGISVNGVAVAVPASRFAELTTDPGVIFDSGTPVTVLPPDVYDNLRQAVSDATDPDYPIVTDDPEKLCFDLTGVETPVFPSVTFHFSDYLDERSVVDFELAPENAFGHYTGDESVYCLVARPATGCAATIGCIAMANHYIETDVESGTIGWVTRDCTDSC